MGQDRTAKETKLTTRFSAYFLDRFIAPGISTFTDAEVPDMSNYDAQSRHWLANYVLNAGLRGNFPAPTNAYVFNFLRRSVAAFTEHDEARRATLAFLADRQSLRTYAAAILHWEIYAGQAWHALLLLRGFLASLTSDSDIPRPFDAGTNSVEERLNRLYNSMKHAESRIEHGQIHEGATLPVWLSNEGICSTDTTLTYEDTAEVLRDLAHWAGIVQDPLEVANKIRAQVDDGDQVDAGTADPSSQP